MDAKETRLGIIRWCVVRQYIFRLVINLHRGKTIKPPLGAGVSRSEWGKLCVNFDILEIFLNAHNFNRMNTRRHTIVSNI